MKNEGTLPRSKDFAADPSPKADEASSHNPFPSANPTKTVCIFALSVT